MFYFPLVQYITDLKWKHLLRIRKKGLLKKSYVQDVVFFFQKFVYYWNVYNCNKFHHKLKYSSLFDLNDGKKKPKKPVQTPKL